MLTHAAFAEALEDASEVGAMNFVAPAVIRGMRVSDVEQTSARRISKASYVSKG